MKAILVIDMPEKCEDCLLYNGDCCCADIQWYLTGELGHREVWHPEKRQDWCPLKPLPNRDPISDEEIASEEDYEVRKFCGAFNRGWNNCLDEIGGQDG